LGNGFLGFESAWMKRFEEINKDMKKVMAGDRISPIAPDHSHGAGRSHSEAADPHYWVSPKCALELAAVVRDLVCELNPASAEEYNRNYETLAGKIREVDKRAEDLFSDLTNRHFMIYHPNLAYIARDYGLEEVAVEFEGKEPSPSRMKELIDLAVRENINTIFIQKEYDIRNARAIAAGTGGEIRIIDPLSEDWYRSVTDIIDGLYTSLTSSGK
ncbi:MAG TPA: zinc ABC transporter substrate-binding protein, partial [Bacteroidales bacterium]|nr:zinc ABC transporter substrate-binding protein [Bacteroidales bacterium]